MNENARDMFIQKLSEEIAWQWKWEKLNRFLKTTTMWVTLFSSFLILVLSFLQLQIGSVSQRWLILSIAVLSVATISCSLISTTMRFQQRQQVYDQMARAYDFIRIQLLTELISLEDAVAAFGKIHCQPTEKLIRETP
jgi:ABC-type nitrate/sulfonate/bicarbonate transport system permease component